MELFYLKDSPFTNKTPQKRQALLNAPKNILTTNAYTKQTQSLKSFKFLSADPFSPRILNEPTLSQNPEYLQKLQKVQNNLSKLSQYKYLLTESQGQTDEIYSRLEDRHSKLSEITTLNNKIQSDLKIRSEETAKTIEALKENIETLTNQERASIFDIESKSHQNESLLSETKSLEQAITSLTTHQYDLNTSLTQVQQKTNKKTLKLESQKSSIQSILSSSQHLHSLLQQDQETKIKILEQIRKFEQIRRT